MSTYENVHKVIAEVEKWIRLAIFLHGPLRSALLEVFHDRNYGGLPRNPADLFHILKTRHRKEIEKLKKKNVIFDCEYELIFPPGKKETFSEQFDVTLLVKLIRNLLNLQEHAKGWGEKPEDNDQSIAANVERARLWRNLLIHDPSSFDLKKFTVTWNNGVAILQGLQYVCDANPLKTASLDPSQCEVLKSLDMYLEITNKEHERMIDNLGVQTGDLRKDMCTLKTELDDLKMTNLAKKTRQCKKETEDNISVSCEKHLKDLNFAIACRMEDIIVFKFSKRFSIPDGARLFHKLITTGENWSRLPEDMVQFTYLGGYKLIRISGLVIGGLYDFRIDVLPEKSTCQQCESYVQVTAVKLPKCDHINNVKGIKLVCPSFGDDKDLAHFCSDILDGIVLQPDDKLSFQVSEGAGVAHFNVREFVLYGESYFLRNVPDYEKPFQFPPSWMIGSQQSRLLVKRFMEMFVGDNTTAAGVKAVIVGYSCQDHYQLFKDCQTSSLSFSKETPILVFCSELNLVVSVQLCCTPAQLEKQVKQCRDNIRDFITLQHCAIQGKEILVVGVVYCPYLNKQQSQALFTFYCGENASRCYHDIFLLRDEHLDDSKNFNKWWLHVFVPFVKSQSIRQDERNVKTMFHKLIGSCMAVIATSDHQLPHLSNDEEKQLATLVLTQEQYDAIHDPCKKKIIEGCFGSGKSVVGREIVKKMMMNEESECTIVYVCLDNLTLFECEMKAFVEHKKKEFHMMTPTVICGSLYELFKQISCNGEPTLSKFLVGFSRHCNSTKVHFVLEEVTRDMLTEVEAITLQNTFQSDRILKESNIVFLLQSVEKKREVVINNSLHSFTVNCIEQIGMKCFSLTRIMRNSHSISRLTRLGKMDASFVTRLPQQKKRNLSKEKKKSTSSRNINDSLEGSTNPSSASMWWSSLTGVQQQHRPGRGHYSGGARPKVEVTTTDVTIDQIQHIDAGGGEKSVAALEIESLDALSGQVEDLPLSSTDLIRTTLEFTSGDFGHRIVGQKPRVVNFPKTMPFYNVYVVLSILLEDCRLLCDGKVTIICSTLEECQQAVYAIEKFDKRKVNYVCYIPTLIGGTTPSLKEKQRVWNAWQNDCDVLITDMRGFRGIESKSVMVICTKSTEVASLCHLFIESLARCKLSLCIFTAHSKTSTEEKQPLQEGITITDVIDKWVYNGLVDYVEVEVVKDSVRSSEISWEEHRSSGNYFVVNAINEKYEQLFFSALADKSRIIKENNLMGQFTKESISKSYKMLTDTIVCHAMSQPMKTAKRKDTLSKIDKGQQTNDASLEFSREELTMLESHPPHFQRYTCKAELSSTTKNENKVTVLAKVMTRKCTNEDRLKFLYELKAMRTLGCCENVTGLIGYNSFNGMHIMLLEYCEFGRVLDYIAGRRRYLGTSLLANFLVSCAYDVAKGMMHVAEHGIIHTNLSVLSVFVSGNGACKVGGFMYAKQIDENGLCIGATPENEISAPEFAETGILSQETDVYSFAIFLWKIHCLEEVDTFSLENLNIILEARYRRVKPTDCGWKMYALMLSCWKSDPVCRPYFREISEWLLALLNRIGPGVSVEDNVAIERTERQDLQNTRCALGAEGGDELHVGSTLGAEGGGELHVGSTLGAEGVRL